MTELETGHRDTAPSAAAREASRHATANRRSSATIGRISNPSGFGRRIPRIAGTIVGLLATVSLLSTLIPPFRHLIRVPRMFVDDYLFPMPSTSLAWTVVLGLLAVSLSLRKRVAWWITVAYLSLYMVLNLLVVLIAASDPSWVDEWRESVIGLTFNIVLLVVLIAGYRQFNTRVRRGALLSALAVLVGGLAAGTLAGWALVSVAPGTLEPHERLPYAFNHVVAFATIDVKSFATHHAPWMVNWVLGLFGALALILAAIVLFRSQRLSSLMTEEDERLVRALLEVYGDDDSLGYFSTRRDKAVVFSPDGRAAITYRVEMSTAVAGGDPVGDPDSWTEAIAEFVALCETYGWHPAVLGVSTRGAEVLHAAGFNAINLGDEALMNAADFSLSGPTMKGVRGSVSRVKRLGVSVRMRRMSELSWDEVEGVVRRADDWRDTKEERGFAMALGRVGDPADGDALLVEAVENEGGDDERVIGMLSFVPWGRSGVSLDLMRRDRGGPNGVVETMVSELAQNAESVGVTRISLNFATFRDVFEYGPQVGARPVMRLVYAVLKFFSKFFQMESLYKSNAKYQPMWKPRYICYEDSKVIPRVALAAMVAEGFVQLPGKHWRAKHYKTGTSSIPEGVDVDALVAELEVEAQSRVVTTLRRPEQVRVRLDKLDRLIDEGVDPYPVAQPPTHTVAQAAAAEAGETVRIAGRLTRKRDFGKVTFADLHDQSGEIQVLVESQAIVAQPLDFASTIDLGDLVEVTGTVGTSRSGELSVLATDWRLNGKCLHPLPDKWSGLTDPEARVRQRYVDLAVSARSRELLITRSAVVRALRDHLAAQGFLEVETPILQQIHGGANATPFRTHINAYNLDLYLRIAPELYLKRLCVGGIEKVFEMGRNFRNEGVDFSHNPEFTSLEAYAAHHDYESMMTLTREMIIAAAVAANGRAVIERTDDAGGVEVVDISGEWPVKSVHAAVSEAAGAAVSPESSADELREICRGLGIAYRPDWDAGHLVLELYEHLVEDRTTFPTFYKDFPTSTSPLTRGHRSIEGVAERWDLVAWGVELGTAYTELTDPVEQRKRLTEQSILAAGGDSEAMEIDEDFLTALEYAMPPTGGLGLGVDRIVMLITGQSIRESLAFPLAKPQQ
ncbi:bifunctional lysylphosphatidylglycerol synthetase/lysine--tRNA ligase LysX [Gordonia neofelifaecis]|uniref:Lysine--tRNA ligase n=1 Tax=Gordonia neofelifaecis NRRL B-59395 TaxID=644548 RepID=F1YMC0_9ACTN|nr:bifunctional lysylphosphatidylglycerol synthetase/lysine--tRNA ligase LysX [Gordonia neofelifaecis]EGD54169.1 lysyl-tRNA synthetase [Gordonia neofelifaecis NRRL B-59395]